MKDTANVTLKQDRKKSVTKSGDYPEIWKHSLMYIHCEKLKESRTIIISKWSHGLKQAQEALCSDGSQKNKSAAHFFFLF